MKHFHSEQNIRGKWRKETRHSSEDQRKAMTRLGHAQVSETTEDYPVAATDERKREISSQGTLGR